MPHRDVVHEKWMHGPRHERTIRWTLAMYLEWVPHPEPWLPARVNVLANRLAVTHGWVHELRCGWIKVWMRRGRLMFFFFLN